ncbi:MAG: protein kinase [Polyangiaceae bacterium]|nr:protein kinase [Polyangiaceae bacterium]
MKMQSSDYAPPPEEGLFRNRHDPIPRGTKLLGKYTVERTLGQGGMGIVVAARHDTLGELVAIKFLLPAGMTNPQAVERFVREARASARLKGEHVVRVHDVDKLETGEPYMLMEYLEGEDLKAILRKRGPLPLGDAVEYFLQACRGVAEAHARHVVHRDLKPANLFLTTTADGAPRVKVFDFGIARIVDPDEAAMTNKGDMVGSVPYMSPEQLLSSRTADWRTDIWSLGVVLYELLTTKRPFDGNNPSDFIGNILNAEPVPLSAWRTDVPPALEAVILWCLRKDRHERYQSADDLATALREALGLPPPMRAPLPSHTESRGVQDLPMAPPPIVHEPPMPPPARVEQTQGTAAGMSITGQPPLSLRTKRTKLAFAGGGAMVTSAAVVTLVLALRGPHAEQTTVNASAVPAVSAMKVEVQPLNWSGKDAGNVANEGFARAEIGTRGPEVGKFNKTVSQPNQSVKPISSIVVAGPSMPSSSKSSNPSATANSKSVTPLAPAPGIETKVVPKTSSKPYDWARDR